MVGVVPIDALEARAYRIPTDAPEADGTLEWEATTLVVVTAGAGNVRGTGYSFADAGAVGVANRTLAAEILGENAMDVPRLWDRMRRRVRNMGSGGIAAGAVSAVDTALWDLKAGLVGLPLADLWGARRDAVPIYGSGGFTSYDDDRLAEQLAGWVSEDGCGRVKMKIGADRRDAERRMTRAKEAIGEEARLMIDANGACTPREALAIAEIADGLGVDWFEEPVTSDDLEGLAFVRGGLPGAVDCAAGEYVYGPHDARRMLEARAVDCLQLDATRCLGYTGFLQAAALAEAFAIPISAHTAPALHLPVCRAAPGLRHIEWFHDHVRIEAMLFEGAPVPRDGAIAASTAAGHGLTFKTKDAERFAL
ncbi:enolase C-terminal domain-like protein [Salinarimonas ramus]|uniref:Mandelate racemase n=1 Tax=Salinarimonas ramus TaxID=690164 RepID=A0A917QFT8_9HYPH|nr:enolase C-terminal domain-like protein [Salinarimonas ramus]GGK48486.1 mandelate racemase [Salinarimonas ramus]